MFKFRLQRILELRTQREQETAGRLSAARSAALSAREAQAELEAIHATSVDRLAGTQSNGAPVGELRNVSYMLEVMNLQIQEARSVSEAADESVRNMVEEFASAFRDRRVLDLLRQRKHEEWKANEVNADRQVMDSVALARFTRRGTAPASGS